MQIIANGKQRFYSFMEFYVIHLKNQGPKIWSCYHIKFAIPPTQWSYRSIQYHVFFANMHYTEHWASRLVAFKNFK